jgi:hypothetical protein
MCNNPNKSRRPIHLFTNRLKWLLRPISRGGYCNVNKHHIVSWYGGGEFFSLYICTYPLGKAHQNYRRGAPSLKNLSCSKLDFFSPLRVIAGQLRQLLGRADSVSMARPRISAPFRVYEQGSYCLPSLHAAAQRGPASLAAEPAPPHPCLVARRLHGRSSNWPE